MCFSCDQDFLWSDMTGAGSGEMFTHTAAPVVFLSQRVVLLFTSPVCEYPPVCSGGQGPPEGSDPEDAEKCPVCLGVLSGGELAMPDSCCHVFCLRCLLTWAEVRLGGDLLFFPGVWFVPKKLLVLCSSCRRLLPALWTEEPSVVFTDGTAASASCRSEWRSWIKAKRTFSLTQTKNPSWFVPRFL